MRENNCRIIIGNEHEVSNPPGWLITFNDLITLLMVFFVLMFAMGNINSLKSEKLVGSFQGALGVLREGKKVGVQIVRPIQPAEPATQEVSGDSSIATSQLSEVSRNAIDDLANDPEITIIQTPKGLSITLSDGILFQSGISELRPEGYPVLNKIIQVLQGNGFDVRIEGHTDNVAIRSGRFPSNWDLSIARAVHVVKYFTDIGKIVPQRLSAVGYGESKPLYPNDSPENRGKNRRVEIILEMMDS
ncbi:MAG: flagellar motor protein MotB [Deltaproteobacteria bacterium]|nr:flagellar motor protein MotB [Deltaproteobacteria bacterium]